jgi:arsenate reductase
VQTTYNALFLCTRNSARSIIAEALTNRWGEGRFRGYSAGSMPKGEVHPLALRALAEAGVPAAGLASKRWDTFAQPGAPAMDFVITLCDQSAGEACPIWPGRPITAHWGLPDPGAVEGSARDRLRAFEETLRVLEVRVQMLVALRYSEADRARIEQSLRVIGQYHPSPTVRGRPLPQGD